VVAAGKSAAIPFLEEPAGLKGLIGGVGFDPLAFSSFMPVDFLVEAELKHCRVAMIATLGFVATDLGLHLPGAQFAVSSAAAHNMGVDAGFMTAMMAFVFPLEGVSALALVQMLDRKSGREPGNYSFDPLNLKGKDAKAQADMKLKEITNGRLAMVAFSGIVTQAVLFDKGFPYL
jgi:light-harvesting complex I chlorophyll a/b binding protein 1